MDGLCGAYTAPDGVLKVSEAGGAYVFDYRGGALTEPVRLVCFDGGRAVPIGIPVPENGGAVLVKRISRTSAEKLGLRRIDGLALVPLDKTVSSAEKPKTDDGAWHSAENARGLFADTLLADACEGTGGMLVRTAGGFTELAVPVSDNEPFPMMPVFCFGESMSINSREYLVFRLKNGRLY